MKKYPLIIMLGLMLTTVAFTWGNTGTSAVSSGYGLSESYPDQNGHLRVDDPTATPTEICLTDCDIPLPRESYAPLDVAKEWERINEVDALNIEYWKSADQSNPLAEIRDSSVYDVSLHFSGYPNSDYTPPDRVMVVYTDPKQAIVTVLSEGMLDDSIIDQEYRIELSEMDTEWKINWAGVRYRCARSGNFEWTTSLCP